MKKDSEVNKIEASSFRDPSGFIFYKNNRIYRQINKIYRKNFDLLMKSGLYRKFLNDKLIVAHKKAPNTLITTGDAYMVMEPAKIPFISYPYEWTFNQLKDAALLTLTIQKMALNYDMSLKDASAYNIQFLEGKPIFIDILSFEKYSEGKPWVAYKQFCQHFLAPLLLMSLVDVRLNQLLRIYIDGIPLDLTSRLLPKRTFLSFSILSHIHFHARSQKKFGDLNKTEVGKIKTFRLQINKQALLAIIENLESTIKKLTWIKKDTEWGEYYSFTNYSKSSFLNKKRIIEKYIKLIKPKNVWDFGSNTGEFSRLASNQGISTVSFDIDPLAVEKNYLEVKEKKEKNILPLIIDLTNPSSSFGWANEERQSLISRGPCDLIMALALVHHLAIGNNLPLIKMADFFSRIGQYLIIEFVPKEDSQVQKLLSNREDIFSRYSQKEFEKSFSNYFKIISCNKIKGSLRSLYLMKKINEKKVF